MIQSPTLHSESQTAVKFVSSKATYTVTVLIHIIDNKKNPIYNRQILHHKQYMVVEY